MARIPKPKAVADLRGDKNKRRVDPEPVPSPDKPICPKWLGAEAQLKWKETVANLDDMGLLSKTDSDAIIMYCQAWSRYRQYEQFLQKNDETYPLNNGYLQQRNEVALMYKNQELCRRYQIEFGLTPAARSRVAIQKKNANSAWGSFFEN